MKLVRSVAVAASLMLGMTTPLVTQARAQETPYQGEAAVQPETLRALQHMSAYLRTLQTFQITADTTVDVVDADGQTLQLAAINTYRVRRPDAFVIDMVSDRKVRTIYYADRKLTVVAPRMGYFAQVDAPATIQETLDLAYEDYGIVLPLEDLFTWTEKDPRTDTMERAYWVGYAKVAGVDSDHYAFRQPDVDWQIWIARGDRPVPVKVVISTRDDEARPQFTSVLTWDTAPRFDAAAFTYKPPADTRPITIARLP